MVIDFCLSVGHVPSPLTREVFERLIDESWLADICKVVAEGNLDAKRRLPAACWQASFGGMKRANANAKSSGLFALDVDHVDDPEALFRSFEHRINELDIYVVHKTPSAHGLRVVARCRPEFDSISQNQAWLAQQIGVEHDACTRDMARLSFLVPRAYFYYYNPDVFSDEPLCTISANDSPQAACVLASPASSASSSSAAAVAPSASSVLPSAAVSSELGFRGVPYSRIVEELVARTGGEPYEGERNNRLYLICRLLANITDRHVELLFQVCPRFGLSEQEVRACCESACKSARTERLPYVLYKVLRDLGISSGGSSSSALNELSGDGDTQQAMPPQMPDESHLPPLIREFVQTASDDFKPATAMVCLPVCGFLGSRLRARYLDGEMQAPSFIVNVIAPAASGKGSLLRIPDICLEKIRQQDDEGRALEAEYLRLCKLNKNARKQVEEPQPIVRDIPAKVSVAQLLKRMVQARGLHLISVSPEADTLTNTNKSGVWAQKSDIYRIAQDADGGRYGQDYRSDASFSATCQMRYNLVTLGTPGAMARAYPDVEDGLITRCIMVELPSQFGKTMPARHIFTARQQRTVNTKVKALMAVSQDEQGNVLPERNMNLGWLNKGIAGWIEQQRLQAVRDDDHARDQFMRRAAMIGFRAGMVAAFLWGNATPEHRAHTIEFALWVSDFILYTLIGRYAGKVNEQAATYEAPKAKRYPSLFEAMADVFTLADLKKAAGVQSIHSPLKSIVHRWTDNNLIEKQGDSFVKLGK